MKIIKYFLILFLFILSCNKVNYSTPIPTSDTKVLNNSKIDINSPIVIYGDTRSNHEIHKKIISLFMQKSPTMVFNTGDLVYNGNNDSLWPVFLDIIKPILKTSRYYPVLGNHERESINYFSLFTLPNNEKWYKIEFKNISFFVLDSNSDLEVNSNQYKWLENELKISKSSFKVLIFHHPIFSVGRHGGSASLNRILTPLMQKYSVQLVFNGHDHAYERFLKDGITYIVTGGGGAPLYDKDGDSDYLKKYIKIYHYCLLNINKDNIIINIYDINNKLIDNITIIKK